MANLPNDSDRHEMRSMDRIFTSSPSRLGALRRLPMFPTDEEVFSESSSFYDSEMDFGEVAPRPQLQRQNAMPFNVRDIPLPVGPAPISATVPIVTVLDFWNLEETAEGDESSWERDFTVGDDEEVEVLYSVPPLDVPSSIPTDFECAICNEEGNEDVVAHPCSLHLFHHDCIAGWLRRHRECPLCRRVRIFVKFYNFANSCIIILLFIF